MLRSSVDRPDLRQFNFMSHNLFPYLWVCVCCYIIFLGSYVCSLCYKIHARAYVYFCTFFLFKFAQLPYLLMVRTTSWALKINWRLMCMFVVCPIKAQFPNTQTKTNKQSTRFKAKNRRVYTIYIIDENRSVCPQILLKHLLHKYSEYIFILSFFWVVNNLCRKAASNQAILQHVSTCLHDRMKKSPPPTTQPIRLIYNNNNKNSEEKSTKAQMVKHIIDRTKNKN